MTCFASPEEFREVMDKAFAIISTDPDVGPKLRETGVVQRYEFPDVELGVSLEPTSTTEDGEPCLKWCWDDERAGEPDVELSMESDVANSYFQGQENIAIAIARRRLKPRGDLRKVLVVIPLTKPVFPKYAEMIAREYPHLVVR